MTGGVVPLPQGISDSSENDHKQALYQKRLVRTSIAVLFNNVSVFISVLWSSILVSLTQELVL